MADLFDDSSSSNFESGPEFLQPSVGSNEDLWEKFLQRQDERAAHYMHLLEKYENEPNRDELIAQEMGWHHHQSEQGEQTESWKLEGDIAPLGSFEDMTPPSLEPASGLSEIFDPSILSGIASFGPGAVDENTLFSLLNWSANSKGTEDPLFKNVNLFLPAVRDILSDSTKAAHASATLQGFVTYSTVASLKVILALDDRPPGHVGLTIALLKRALKLLNHSLTYLLRSEHEGAIDHQQREQLEIKLFEIRDRVVVLIGENRRRWSQQFGV